MIRIFLGKLGSGKSLCAVRELVDNPTDRVTFTNLILHDVPKTKYIQPQDVITKKEVEISKNKKKIMLDLNTEYWLKQKKPLNILWDEIQLSANARSSQSRVNMILTRFISMGRRITGFDNRGYGSLTFISQHEELIDINFRRLSSEIYYHVGYWTVRCEECGRKEVTSSELEDIKNCKACGSWKILREGMQVKRYKFVSWNDYLDWICHKMKKGKVARKEIFINNEKYFKYYDTLQMISQWDGYINDT